MGDLCNRYSEQNVVKYELCDEWWGGCAKIYSRRRFLIVTMSNNETDVEQLGGRNGVPVTTQATSTGSTNHTTMMNNRTQKNQQTATNTFDNELTSTNVNTNGGSNVSLFNNLSKTC